MIVATFNIHHGVGIDGRLDLGRTADAITETNADVIALQELDRGNPRSEASDQPRALADLTGLDVQFFATVSGERFEYGIALGSRTRRDVTFVSLPRLGREEPRAAIVSEGEGATIIATHLATRPPARTLHMRALADLVADARPPVVLLGDLNARGRALRPLRDAGLVPGPSAGPTMTRRRKSIDWILATHPARVVAAHTIRTPASDHLPLVATVELPAPGGAPAG